MAESGASDEGEVLALVGRCLGELRAYLRTAEAVKSGELYGTEPASNVNAVITELAEMTKTNYDRYRISVVQDQWGIEYSERDIYISRVAGLVGRLEQEYGLSANAAASAMPGINILLNQITQVTLTTEITQFIDSRLTQYEEGTRERAFLAKLRDLTTNVKDAASLIGAVTQAAIAAGLSVAEIAKVFPH